jgi:hypothetical protein
MVWESLLKPLGGYCRGLPNMVDDPDILAVIPAHAGNPFVTHFGKAQ